MAKKNNVTLLDSFDVESAVATEFRRLFYNVLAKSPKDNPLSVLVSSATVAEGKTTVASFLAITAAVQTEQQTLLIDCDLRKPSVHRLFGLTLSPGLGEITTEKTDIDNMLNKTSLDNLHVLTAGKVLDNPIDYINRGVVNNVIRQLKARFAFIIVDCAPIIPVSDPLLLAPCFDGLLLVIKAGSTDRNVVRRAYDLIEKTSVNIVGVVLNNVSGVLPSYYNLEYYGYEYGAKRKPRKH